MNDEPVRPERRLWGADIDKDVDDELAFHLEMRERDFAGVGLTPEAAREAAARRFGDVEAIADACRTIDQRWIKEQRRAGMWTDFRQDAAYAVRALTKNPGFTAVAVLTLALGIGATTAIFSILYSVMLRPLPYADPGRVVFVWSLRGETREPLTPGRLLDFRDQLTSVTGLAGISQISVNLTGGGEPERLSGSSVSSAFFDTLGVRPLHGETFHAGAADSRAVVLSHKLWVRRFGADPAIVGRDITINGTPRRVAAVMPQSFEWPQVTGRPTNMPGPELWLPGTSRDIPRTPSESDDDELAKNRGAGYLRAVGRLKAGYTLAQAQQEVEAIAARLAEQYPVDDGGRSARVTPLREQFFGSVREPLMVLVGAVGFVLAIACANVASLQLGRATSRRKEIALRLALGANRARIIRQLLTESLVLAAAGGAAGLVLASWGRAWLTRSAPPDVISVSSTGLEPITLAFAFALALLTGLGFGLVPAWQASAAGPGEDLKDGGSRTSSGPRTGRTRDVLVAAQVGVALVLLVGAALLLRSFVSLTRVDTGIDTRNLLTFDMFLGGERAQYQNRQIPFYDEALTRIRAIPGVTAAGAAVTLPIGGDDFGARLTIEGRPLPPEGEEPQAGFQIVTPGYFDAMGIRLLAGRDFRAADTRDAPTVVLVNQTLARQHWPGEDPIGRRIRLGRGAEGMMTIVGVVSDIRHFGPAAPPRPEFYQVHAQRSFPFMAFVVRTAGDPASVVPSIRAAINGLDPLQPISGVATMDEHIAKVLSRPKFMSTLITAFGVLALALAVVGIYGVMAYSVSQRSQEIAIRMALGARRGNIVRMILSKAAILAGAGIAAGLAGALATTRLLAGLLFGVSTTDAPTFAGACAVLVIVALGAAVVPAARASRISGAGVLRS